jgi:hypothetical protein
MSYDEKPDIELNRRGVMLAAAVVIFLAGCGRVAMSERENHSECLIGERLHSQTVKGRILADMETRVSVSSCPESEMRLVFLGSAPEEFMALRRRATDSMSVLGFQGQSTGFIVRDNPKTLLYVAISLDDPVEDRQVTRAGAE